MRRLMLRSFKVVEASQIFRSEMFIYGGVTLSNSLFGVWRFRHGTMLSSRSEHRHRDTPLVPIGALVTIRIMAVYAFKRDHLHHVPDLSPSTTKSVYGCIASL